MDSHVNTARWGSWLDARRLPYLKRSVKDRISGSPTSRSRGMDDRNGEHVSPKRRRLNPNDEPRGNSIEETMDKGSTVDAQDDDLDRFLEIDVIGIDSLSADVENSHQPSRVRCTIALYHPASISTSKGPTTKYTLLLSDTAKGTIQTTVDDAGHSTTRILLSQPFKIPLGKLYVNKISPADGEDDDSDHDDNDDDLIQGGVDDHGMAKNYALQIRLERVGRKSTWPPLQLQNIITRAGDISRMLSTGIWSIGDIQLFAKDDDLPRTQTSQQKLGLGLMLGADEDMRQEMTGYQLVVNVTWPSSKNRLKTTKHAMDEIAETPVIRYTFEDQVSHKEKVLDGFRCIFCLEDLHTQPFLLFHLNNQYPSWQFAMKKPDQSSSTYYVSVKKSPRAYSTRLGSRSSTLQLGLSKDPFDLDKFVDGDKSWILNRKGILDDSGLASPSQSSISPSLDSPRRSASSPNTDVDMEDAPMRLKLTRRKILVPKTEKPLYDILTKRVLVPGEEFSDSEDDQVIHALSRKHVDIINDFSDVTDEEKDYIIHWDEFMRKQNVSASCYFAPALMKFLGESGRWFCEKDSRSRQFGLHLSKLALEGTITVKDMAQCTRKLREIQQDSKL